MRFDIAFKNAAALSGVGLVAFSSSIRDASARLVASSDILENIKESKSFVKNKGEGEECIRLETDVSKKEDAENVDIGVLGCGDAFICLEDDTSSTGARCVDFVVVDEGVPDYCPVAGGMCGEDYPECCDGLKCEIFYVYDSGPFGQCHADFVGGKDEDSCTASWPEYCVNPSTYEKMAECCDGKECRWINPFGSIYGAWYCL